MHTALDARKGIVKGSLTDIAAAQGHSLAQTFVNAEVVVIVDTSGNLTIDGQGGNNNDRIDISGIAWVA